MIKNNLKDVGEDKEVLKLRKMLSAYQKAINEIDDGFEYTYGNSRDRDFLFKVLKDLTFRLTRIDYNENNNKKEI